MKPVTVPSIIVAPAEASGEPRRHRRGDRGGDEVERDHPGDLVLGRRQRSADLGQHQVGERDRHVEQHVGELHHQHDQPLLTREARNDPAWLWAATSALWLIRGQPAVVVGRGARIRLGASARSQHRPLPIRRPRMRPRYGLRAVGRCHVNVMISRLRDIARGEPGSLLVPALA